MKHTQRFAGNKKCFGVSDRFIGSKDSSPTLLHCSISKISLPLSFDLICSFGSKMCGIADIHVKKTPAVKDRTDPWWTCAPCFPPSDSVGPSGKRLQLSLVGVVVVRGGGGGVGARERERAERRGDALRSVSGFMELCITDPPPWIAIRDHSFWFYTFSCAAVPLPFPSSTPPTKVSELSLHGHVFLHARACRAWVRALGLNGCASALFALGAVQIFNDTPVWSARWGQQSWAWTQTWGTWLPTAGLPSAPDNSCLNEDEWIEQWRDRSRSAHRRVDGGRVEPRRQLWCLLRLEMSLLN